MYALVEIELAEIMVAEGLMERYEEYAVTEGKLALVDRYRFTLMVSALHRTAEYFGVDVGMIQEISTDIVGIHTILSPFWINVMLLHAITSGETKATESYQRITETRLSNITTNALMDVFRTNIAPAADTTQEIQDDDSEGTVGGSEIIPEEPSPAPVIAEPDNRSMAIKFIEDLIGTNINGESQYFFTLSSGVVDDQLLSDLAGKIQKNIVITSASTIGGHRAAAELMNIMLKKYQFYDNTVIIHTAPDINSKFVRNLGDSTWINTLFGSDVRNLYQLNCGDQSGSRPIPISGTTLLGRAFVDYDYIYRDHHTGIIWALQKKNEIFFMINFRSISEHVQQILFNELGDRYMGSLSYQEMLDRDIKYFNGSSQVSKDFFVSLAVSGATSFIENVKDAYIKAKEEYCSSLDTAMEDAKKVQKLKEQIAFMDEDKIRNEAAAKYQNMYNDVLSLPKVKAIRVIEQTVHVYTKNIYVQHSVTGKWHDIGTFHIAIRMYDDTYNPTNTVRISNTKHQIKAFHENMQAPHVFKDGHLCHGNIIGAMTDAYGRRDLFQMSAILIMFLESANIDDAAGAYLSHWPEVSKEEAFKTDSESGHFKICEEKNEIESDFDDRLEIPVHTT